MGLMKHAAMLGNCRRPLGAEGSLQSVNSQQGTGALSPSVEIKLVAFLGTPYVTLSEPPSFSGFQCPLK